jgi:hypothetical protein
VIWPKTPARSDQGLRGGFVWEDELLLLVPLVEPFDGVVELLPLEGVVLDDELLAGWVALDELGVPRSFEALLQPEKPSAAVSAMVATRILDLDDFMMIFYWMVLVGAGVS